MTKRIYTKSNIFEQRQQAATNIKPKEEEEENKNAEVKENQSAGSFFCYLEKNNLKKVKNKRKSKI